MTRVALVKCKDCGTDVSSEAKACPRCGRNPRPFPILRVVLLLILALVVSWAALVIRKFEAESDAAAHAADLGRGAPQDRSDPPRPRTPEQQATARAKLAYDVWTKFDRLPDSMRTLPMVQAHLLQATQFADGVDEPWATQIRSGSEANARIRVALLLNGSTDTGETHAVFVLAQDPGACDKRKPQFEPGTNNAGILKSWGFKSLRCPGTGEIAFVTWDLR